MTNRFDLDDLSQCEHKLDSVPDRKIAAHFIRDMSRDSSKDRWSRSIDSNYNSKTMLKKSSLSKLAKKDCTNISIANGKSMAIEEHSTQAYELRSLNINSKLSCVFKRGSISHKNNLPQHSQCEGVPGIARKLSAAKEEEYSEEGSSLLHCRTHPDLTVFCEKNPIFDARMSSKPVLDQTDHVHSRVKGIKHSIVFKNRFSGHGISRAEGLFVGYCNLGKV